jgi:predicted metal-dependent phosphoesterase TrpH
MTKTASQPVALGRRGRADIHIHTTYSDGLATPAQVVRFAEKSDLDLIAITDHDSVAGALEARELAARYPLMGVETLNPSPAGRITRAKLQRLNARWGLAEVGGSDAHFLCRIGTAYTEFAGRSAADFRASLLANTTSAGELPLPHPHVPLRDYVRQSGRSMFLNPAQKIQRRLARGA